MLPSTYESLEASTLTLEIGTKAIYNYAMVRDGANVRFYKNEAYEDCTFTNNSGALHPASGPDDGVFQRNFTAIHARDLRIYDRALSHGEMMQLVDPAMGWDLFAVPSSRTYFHIPSTPSTARAGVVTRTRKGARPSLFTGVNQDSPRAEGLVLWYPLNAPWISRLHLGKAAVGPDLTEIAGTTPTFGVERARANFGGLAFTDNQTGRLTAHNVAAFANLPVQQSTPYSMAIWSAANLPSTKVLLASYLNIRDLLNYDKVILPVKTLDALVASLG